jgi:hypothetical protein
VNVPIDEDQVFLAKGGPGGGAKNSLQVSVSGLPAGVLAALQLAGPRGYLQPLTASTTVTGLADGNYTLTGSRVTSGGTAYDPSPASQTKSLRKGATGSMSVTYAAVPTTGALTVTISIAESTPVPVTVTGPNAFNQPVPSTQTLSNLAPGTYTVNAPNFTAPSGVSYVSSATAQTVSVVAGATASRSVTYTATTVPPGGLNLQILGMYLTQSTQTLSNNVPLVLGRDGYLRVFAAANGATSSLPSVRARVYQNGALTATYTAATPSGGVPTSLNEASATTSWNIKIPGSVIQSGFSILADVDPTNSVAEAVETDNNYPVSGTPLALTVNTVPTLAARFVPVLQSGTGQQGNVTTSNAATFLVPMQDMFPLRAVTSSVRAPYTTSTTLLSDGTGWSAVLSEVRAVRTADGSSDHYYGVVKVGYGSGVAGIGYIGLPTSLGWDYLPSGAGVLAHEFGHNFGRQHAPCGGPSNPDPNFPYAGGIIGAYGYNVRTNALIPRTNPDLMTYCGPEWISDYTYKAVLNYRGFSASTTSAAMTDGLLVWGRINADGSIVLEPSFRVRAPAALPRGQGAYLLEGLDAGGNQLFAFSFDPDATSDHAGAPESHFAFVVPLSDALHARLQEVEVAGRGRSSTRASGLGATQLQGVVAGVAADAAGTGRARLRWNAAANGAAMVMVRDAQSGQVLSLARGGDVTLATGAVEVDVVVSDGVRSQGRRLRIGGR